MPAGTLNHRWFLFLFTNTFTARKTVRVGTCSQIKTRWYHGILIVFSESQMPPNYQSGKRFESHLKERAATRTSRRAGGIRSPRCALSMPRRQTRPEGLLLLYPEWCCQHCESGARRTQVYSTSLDEKVTATRKFVLLPAQLLVSESVSSVGC